MILDVLSYYFGKQMLVCLIQNASSDYIRERFSLVNETASKEFITTVEAPNKVLFFERMVDDWSKGQVYNVFTNTNMKYSQFRREFLEFVKNYDSKFLKKLVDTSEQPVYSVLVRCCYHGDISWVQWCLLNGINANKCEPNGVSPLYIACKEGHKDIMLLLLEHGANMQKCRTDNGGSYLHTACQNGHLEIVEFFIKPRLDINQCTTDKGLSPLYIACKNGYTNIVKLLLSNNADINMCTTDIGASPLYVACYHGHTEIVEVLLKNGAEIDKRTSCNTFSPLLIACLNSHTDIVRLLLNNGADPFITLHGNQLVDVDREKGYIDIVQMLEQFDDVYFCIIKRVDKSKCDKKQIKL